MTATRPLARRLQARGMRVVNVPMRLVLSLPFRTPMSRRLMLLRYHGRRTGKLYRQPLSYVRDAETLLTPGGGTWTLSLAADRAEQVRLAGGDILLRPELIDSVDEIQDLIKIMAKSNPVIRRFIGIAQQPDGDLDPEALQRAIDHGFRIVRWHREPAA